MASRMPGCLGDYDFDHIAYYARKRFIEGFDTVTLMQQATSEKEKEEIALVAMLDIEENIIQDMKLCCRHAEACNVTVCRKVLKEMIEQQLVEKPLLN